MGHPLIEEFCRVSGQLRPEFFRRCQREFREHVNPIYEVGLHAQETIAQKDAEIADLRTKLESLQGRAAKRKAEAVVE